jgi:hypothetical protein
MLFAPRLGRMNILWSEAGISSEQLTQLHPLPEFPEHEFYRHARALDDGLSAHDLGIDFDSLVHLSRVATAARR